jgi:hypothetical protein
MAERFAYLYEAAGAISAAEILRVLGPAGLRIANPDSGRITLLDVEGEPVPVTLAELDEQLAHNTELSFQLWFAGEHDLYARLRRTAKARVLELGMEGTSPPERARIAAALRAYVVSRPALCMGLVFDPEGVTADYVWDAFFLSGAQLDGHALGEYWPAALVLRGSDLTRTVNLRPTHALTKPDTLVCVSDDPAWQ